MVYLNTMGFGGRPLVLGPTVDTYGKYDKSNILCEQVSALWTDDTNHLEPSGEI